MKKFIQNKKIFIALAVFCLGAAVSLPALAAITYQIEFPLPNMPSGASADPGVYISYFFLFGLGLVGFLAVAAIVVGGIMYMTGGTVGKVDRAKQIIWGAITGVVLLLCSYLLLYTIDPTLVNLSPFQLRPAGIPASQGGTQCNTGEVFNPATSQCLTQQQLQQQLQQQYAQPSNTANCTNPATCTEANCGPGAIGSPGNGHCSQGERWDQTGGLSFGRSCSCYTPATAN